MEAKAHIWCDKDDHYLFENFVDFNAWLDSDDGTALREEYKINGVSRPSKAFYAGDMLPSDDIIGKLREAGVNTFQ